MKVLSGGEKSRLALAKLLLSPVNLLILDEPTNHLDMISKDILKNALLMFDGTLIVVSHDRDFLQGLTQKVFEFRDGKVKQHIGDIYDFLEKRRIATLDQLGMVAKAAAAGQSEEVSLNKINYEKKRQQEKDLRKITSRIEKVEQEIHQFESEIASIDQKLASPENHVEALADGTIYERYESLKNKLVSAMDDWEALHSELDNFKNAGS
ncbi:ATP-binding cassette (ABC) antibiotic efflux pump [anaerobic digester metagenome]